ncbi:MAG: ATP synthase F1 subunit epsilon [Thermoanaerobaculia bacterium]|jgi:F-type H+-transporting ATPase subunit epsilon|nr:ATP synthase F1 subunit epsilon [Thermoanaerobaculia bacterium]MBP9825283.1 ATP synthase F1 subunit epsilon [Thermoanaerobaculia bacterium]
MANSFHLSVVTPEREVLSLEARFVALPAYDGEMGILAQRAPLLAKLGAGLLRVEEAGGAKRKLFIAGGFAQMVDDRLTILTEEAQEPDKITAEAAKSALAAAAKLPNGTESENQRRAQATVRARAMGRLAKA